MPLQELIGVYNADGGLAGEMRYVVGHLLGKVHCGLCDVTHSPVRRKRQWDQWVDSLGVPVRLYHLNEMPDDVADVVAVTGSPVFLARSDDTLRVLLDAAAIDATSGSVQGFATQVESSLHNVPDA